ncbi:MAG: hypothetical protein ABJN69_12230 [Hellea sp.]
MKRILVIFAVVLLAAGFFLKDELLSKGAAPQKLGNPPQISERLAKAVIEPISYQAFLENAAQARMAFTDDASAKASLFQWVHNDMFEYWDDTQWDFYGMSRIAGEGEIACGYFVTTLLKDLGFDIDRIRLAKARSGVMIEELTRDIKKTNSLNAILDYVKAQPEGSVFIIGLDFHTGFITSAPDGIYFLHSNYIGREGVVREYAISSEALHDSGFYMIGNLSTRADIMDLWQKNG